MNEYLEREAVVRYLKGYSEKECNSNSPYGMITSSVLNKAERALSEMPAADVQTVKRGRWIAENRDNRGYADCYTCTNCNCYTYTYTLMKDCEYDYCPNCGARMEQEG